jgi:hypothetical protein
MAVEIRKMGADAAQVDEPVDGSKQVVSGDVILKREFVKQRRLRFLLWSHHRQIPQSIKELNQRSTLQSSKSFSTKSARSYQIATARRRAAFKAGQSSAGTAPLSIVLLPIH